MKMKKILYVTTVSSTVNAFLVPHIKMLINDDNIVDCAFNINKPLDETIAYLETFEGALESACWYWKSGNLNATCDKNDIISMTKKINGGTIGINDRTTKYEKYKSLLA